MSSQVRFLMVLWGVVIIGSTILYVFFPKIGSNYNLFNVEEPVFPSDFPKELLSDKNSLIIDALEDEIIIPVWENDIRITNNHSNNINLLVQIDTALSINGLWSCDSFKIKVTPQIKYEISHSENEKHWGSQLESTIGQRGEPGFFNFSEVGLNLFLAEELYSKRINVQIDAFVKMPEPNNKPSLFASQNAFEDIIELQKRSFNLYLLTNTDEDMIYQYNYWKSSHYKFLFFIGIVIGIALIGGFIYYQIKATRDKSVNRFGNPPNQIV